MSSVGETSQPVNVAAVAAAPGTGAPVCDSVSATSSPAKPTLVERIAQLAPMPDSIEVNSETGQPALVQSTANTKQAVELSPRSEAKLQSALEYEFAARGLKVVANPKTPPKQPQASPSVDPALEYYGSLSPAKVPPELSVDLEEDTDTENPEDAEVSKSGAGEAVVGASGGDSSSSQQIRPAPAAEAEPVADASAETPTDERARICVQDTDADASSQANTPTQAQAASEETDEGESGLTRDAPLPHVQAEEVAVASEAKETPGAEKEIKRQARPEKMQRTALQGRGAVAMTHAVESVDHVTVSPRSAAGASGSAAGSPRPPMSDNDDDDTSRSPLPRHASLAETNDNTEADATLASAAIGAVDSALSQLSGGDMKALTEQIAAQVTASLGQALGVSIPQTGTGATNVQGPATPIFSGAVAGSGLGLQSPMNPALLMAQNPSPKKEVKVLSPEQLAKERTIKLRRDAKNRRAAEIAQRKKIEEGRLLLAGKIDPMTSLQVKQVSKISQLAQDAQSDVDTGAVRETGGLTYNAAKAAAISAAARKAEPVTSTAAPAPANKQRNKYPLTQQRLAAQKEAEAAEAVVNAPMKPLIPVPYPEALPVSEKHETSNSRRKRKEKASPVPAPPVNPPAASSKLPSQRAKQARLHQLSGGSAPAAAAVNGSEDDNPVGVTMQQLYTTDAALNAVLNDVVAGRDPTSPSANMRGSKPLSQIKAGVPASPVPLYSGIGDGAMLPAVGIPRARSLLKSEDKYDSKGHLIAKGPAQLRSSSGEKVPKSKGKAAPLYKRLEEQAANRDMEEEHRREEAFAQYRIQRAQAHSTPEEIAEHKRVHDQLMGLKKAARDNDIRKQNDGGVNIEPRELQYSSNHQLAAAVAAKLESLKRGGNVNVSQSPGGKPNGYAVGYGKGINSGAGKHSSDKVEMEMERDAAFQSHFSGNNNHGNGGRGGSTTGNSPTKNPRRETKWRKMVREEIAKKKVEGVVEEEEKKMRYARKKEFSDQVRDTFLPGGPREKKDVRWSRDENYTYDAAESPTGKSGGQLNYKGNFDPDSRYADVDTTANRSPASKALGKIYSADTDSPSQLRKVVARQRNSNLDLHDDEPLSPRVNRNGLEYIQEVMGGDTTEAKMAKQYENHFSSFF